MFYRLLKPIATLAAFIYFKKINVNKKQLLNHSGPLLLASNHPNSFLDAILLCILFKKPLYALARGDAFKNKWIAKILYQLNMLPVYREREGSENLHHNYNTFNKCLETFKHNGIVLIFSESICVNEWHLRPIKKGTARLAAIAWENNIPLQILPVGLNYSNFNSFGKIVDINFGTIIEQRHLVNDAITNGKLLNELTQNIQQQLSGLVYEIDTADKVALNKYFTASNNTLRRVIFSLPAMAGWFLHGLLYYPLIWFIYKKTKYSDHYDSLILALFFLSYPLFILLFIVVINSAFNTYQGLWSILILPFLAWSYIQIKKPV
jgi:1-acyl-sn-glycerol-3-phosphate acyltransferase